MHALDILIVVWIIGGTLATRAMLAALRGGRIGRGLFVVAVLFLAGVPVVLVNLKEFPYSALTVVLAGFALIWLCIPLGRMDNAA